MADTSTLGTLFVSGVLPFFDHQFAQDSLTGSVANQITGSFPLSGSGQLPYDGITGVLGVTSGGSQGEYVINAPYLECFTSGVIEKLTIEGHPFGEPFFVFTDILRISGVL